MKAIKPRRKWNDWMTAMIDATANIFLHFTLSFLSHTHSPSPVERYSFVALGNDWPTTTTTITADSPNPASATVVPPRRRSNPLKRAWRRRVLRRIMGRRS
jgi:hypothetical protein